MSHVKSYIFTLYAGRTREYVDTLQTAARTLSEAEVDFRDYLRVNNPMVLDNIANYAYRVEVRRV